MWLVLLNVRFTGKKLPISCYTPKQQARPKLQRGCSSYKTTLLSIAPVHFFLIRQSFLAMMVILLPYNVKLTCRLVFTAVQNIPFSMFTLQARKSLRFTSVNTSSCTGSVDWHLPIQLFNYTVWFHCHILLFCFCFLAFFVCTICLYVVCVCQHLFNWRFRICIYHSLF